MNFNWLCFPSELNLTVTAEKSNKAEVIKKATSFLKSVHGLAGTPVGIQNYWNPLIQEGTSEASPNSENAFLVQFALGLWNSLQVSESWECSRTHCALTPCPVHPSLPPALQSGWQPR